MCDEVVGPEEPHLGGRIHGGFQLEQLCDHFNVALLGGQMESIETILRGEERLN